MSWSQQPAVPSALVAVQLLSELLPAQAALREYCVAVPVHAAAESHPCGHTSEPSVALSRSQVGRFRPKPIGTVSTAYGE